MDTFAGRLLTWFDRHGRHNLPWQKVPTPYRVWVSEIMLQQTQVRTVIPYYERFMARFPDCAALAAAPAEAVLAHWSGLGYYARARNLHSAARLIVEQHRGELPESLDHLQALPGIGRSTAGAILALSRGERHPILDGNVKRVLARYHAVPGWPGAAAVQNRLWQLADDHTPGERVAEYTQAIMDLGATVCTRTRPRCEECPAGADCTARAEGNPARYPEPKPRRDLPVRRATLLIATDSERGVLLSRRPPTGVWGGLLSLPELADESADAWCGQRGLRLLKADKWPAFRHTFSHFHLEIAPIRLHVDHQARQIMEPAGCLWYKAALYNQLELPAPIKRLLGRVASEPEESY